MKTSCLKSMFVLGLLMHTVTNVVQAEATQESEWGAGWSGYIQLLGGGYSRKGLEIEHDDNRTINSLDQNTGRDQDAFLGALWRLNYGFNQGRTKVFFGMPEYGLLENDESVEIGLSHALANGSVLSVSYVPKLSVLDTDVWQDPYLTGRQRDRSDARLEALRFAADYIFGTPLSIRYDYGDRTIKDDRAGESLSFRLTAIERRQLQRSRKYHQVRAMLPLLMANNFYLIPGLRYTRGNAEGAANSFDAGAVELTFAYQLERFEFFGHANFALSRYRASNPVFNRTRRESSYGITVGVSYLRPFGWENIKVDLIAGSSQRNTNIRFYDVREESLALGLSYQF